MTTTLTAIFDGEVLRPEGTVRLKPNARYRVIVEDEVEVSEGLGAWDMLEQIAGTVETPEDWATKHDHYLYGTSKRQNGANC